MQGTYTNSSGSTQTLTFTLGINGSTGAAGTDGTAGSSANPNGVTGTSGNGGLGGNGGSDTTITVGGTTIASALGGNGGNGGNGGAGGQGGQGSSSTGANGTSGTNGSAGSNGTGGNVSTTNSEAPSAQITVTAYVPPAVTPAPLVTLTFLANGGTCTTTSVSGPSTAWVALPGALDCRKTGAVLDGWRAGNDTFWPDQAVQLSDNNTLTAVWHTGSGPAGPTGSGTGSGSGAGTKPGAAVRVVWTIARGRAVLSSGRPAALAGVRAVFTIDTRAPGKVTASDIALARSLAKRYRGTYQGLRLTSEWRAPHIVAKG